MSSILWLGPTKHWQAAKLSNAAHCLKHFSGYVWKKIAETQRKACKAVVSTPRLAKTFCQ